MQDLKNKVAVITGGASGIGRRIAERCVQEGMKVVLADVEAAALAQAESELKRQGATILAVQTDVSKLEDIEALAHKTVEAFGAVHLLFNNAGVAAGGTIWGSTQTDWEWVMGVNLWGVIHGLRVFVPLMLTQDSEGHIVNTASVAGLLPHSATPSCYRVTKHAVVALSEQLYFELAEREAKVKTSVLCPGLVNTQILESGRNRPAALQNEDVEEPLSPEVEARRQAFGQALQEGMSPQTVADIVFAAIREEQFYILPNVTEAMWSSVQTRVNDLLHRRNPTLPTP